MPDVLAWSDYDGFRAVVLGDRNGAHRLQIEGGGAPTAHLGAVVLPFDDALDVRMHGIKRLLRKLSGVSGGPVHKARRLTSYRRYRLILALRALDGDLEGASRREIGSVLFPGQADGLSARDWKTASLRKRVGRLILAGRAMMNGGYRQLLRGSLEQRR